MNLLNFMAIYRPWDRHPWKKSGPEPILPKKVTKDIQPCKHDMCPECNGSGTKSNGQRCVHALSCPCPRCNPYTLKA
jgi:hypothetical protein